MYSTVQSSPDRAPEQLRQSQGQFGRQQSESDLRGHRTITTAIKSSFESSSPSLRSNHSRDTSSGSKPANLSINAAAYDPRQAPSLSPRFFRSRSRAGSGVDGAGSPQTPGYGHNRQTSVVPGIQHSRDGSGTSSSSNTASPHINATPPTGAHVLTMAHLESDAIASPAISTPGSTSDGFTSFTQRRMGRGHSGRRREHGHHRSQSRNHHKDEVKTVGEYALHVLFTSFIHQAEEKINLCIATPLGPEPRIEDICGVGVDPRFDKLIGALGHIASDRPRPLIDTLMLWRKNKSDAAAEARSQLQQLRAASNTVLAQLPRRNTEPGQFSPDSVDAGTANTYHSLSIKQQCASQGERASMVAIYILCRVLTEVIGQSTLEKITPETEDKLEHIIYVQLKLSTSEQLTVSPIRLANWFLFSELLGVMSGINFDNVAYRFIKDLEQAQKKLIAKNPTANRETEGNMELVLAGMKHLRLKTTPATAWEHSSNFMLALGRLFAISHGQRLKYAYCAIIEALLLGLAAKPDVDFGAPKWIEVLGAIGPRLGAMFVKPRHWQVAFPLTATLLCVSPIDRFSAQWLQMILPLQPKLRNRVDRALCLQVASRLLWTYIYRAQDSSTKRIDEVVKLFLPPGKRTYISTDATVAEPLIEMIRIIGHKHQEYCFKNIIFPLISADLFTPGRDPRDLKIEQLEPERMAIGIRTFLAVISDLEKGEDGRPVFPLYNDAVPSSATDKTPTSPVTSPVRVAFKAASVSPSEEQLSMPVNVGLIGDVASYYYTRFCEILGKITIICDNTFGGQAVLDEKFNVPAPKTPMAETFNFGRKDDLANNSVQKQSFYDLLHVAVKALPRCLSADMPFNALINLLCTGTAHVQSSIAVSSAQSLKAIARQSHAQRVTIGFARFIFSFDDKYSTMSDGGLLGSAHIESTLRLYVELLHIWIDEIRTRENQASGSPSTTTPTETDADQRAVKLDRSGIWTYIDEIEAQGFFFLCSQSRRVRGYAVTVLRLVTEFDAALKAENPRLIHTMERDSLKVIDVNAENLSVAERSRLQLQSKKSNPHATLVDLCGSDNPYDAPLWLKIFPNLMRVMYDTVPFAVTLGRELVLNRVLQMYNGIETVSEHPRKAPFSAAERFDAQRLDANSRNRASSGAVPEVMIEQWKLYLVVACSTMTDTGGNVQEVSKPMQHVRKGSRSPLIQSKITSARALFKLIIPLLSATLPLVRDSVVIALGSINRGTYRTLLEELQASVGRCNDEARSRLHQRSASSPRRNKRTDLLRTEITQVYRLTAHFLHDESVYRDDWTLNNLIDYTNHLKLFLMDGEVQMDWEFQRLRRHYCGLMEDLFEGINRTKDPSRWMTFETRKSSFALMEDWCGYSPNQTQIREREESMRQLLMIQQVAGDRGPLTANMEKEKNSLRTAALSAMAALCGGPISFTTDSRAMLQFDIRRMLAWLDAIFSTESDRMHTIGRRALKNLIIHNKDVTYLLEWSIARCYVAENTKSLRSYFEVVTQVLLEHPDYPVPFWRLLGIGLFTLGSDQSEIRSKALMMLKALESRQQRSSKIQDFDISISDKTKAVYKLAQFEISKRLSIQHSELAFLIFSEFTVYFKTLQPNSQRNMVAAILPWIQIVELQIDPNGGPTAQSYVLLTNLFEITIKSSSALHNEVQALWQALATGPHAGNVQLVLDFIMSLCLDRREQNFVEYAKQIVVFLSSTPAGMKVVEFLLLQITPKAMIPNEKRDAVPPPPDTNLLPYFAELSEALPVGAKQAGISLGQLSLILLVDLMVSPIVLPIEDLSLLLQVITVLWDHYTPLVQDQAREMLIHLIHELVNSKVEDQGTIPSKKSIEDFIESVRQLDTKVIWAYEDSTAKGDDLGAKVPASMEYLTTQVVDTFKVTYPGIKEQWGKMSLLWATSCPVRHVACRSFQIFRCVLTSLDHLMLGDMLARLSNTIADEDAEIQTFSMEILTTLKILITKLSPTDLLRFPQLFWTTCACLDTINEREFLEAMSMLDELLIKLDLTEPHVRQALIDGKPPKWDGDFEGLQPLIHKGLRSSLCLQQTLATMMKLVTIPSNDMVGGEHRLLFAILGNFPSFLYAFDQDSISAEACETAIVLAHIAEEHGSSSVATVLNGFSAGKYATPNDFLVQLVAALEACYFPKWDFRSLVFTMGLLTNKLAWFKIKTMQILCVLIPRIDMRRADIACHGPDLISPCLRLLQTEFCMQTLAVLDHIMTMAGTPMDKQHLRMSMTTASSRATRKEYERTQSLFGIPEESGWAVAMPARHAELTRTNVHAAFYMCQSSQNVDVPPAETPDVEFHVDDFHYDYFEPERADTMMSGDDHSANIGDLVMKLDSLDDFFEDALSSGSLSDAHSSQTITEYANEAQIYDEQTLPILAHSFSRSDSSSSFQNGFADSRPIHMVRESSLNAMTPGAFSSLAAGASKRPSLHARSVTSPSAAASVPVPSGQNSQLEPISDDSLSPRSPQTYHSSGNPIGYYAEEVFSDGDDERYTRTISPTRASRAGVASKDRASPMERARSGMRRLTGGRSRESERAKEIVREDGRRGTSQPPSMQSPRVPKVPAVFLRTNSGLDMVGGQGRVADQF